MPGTVISGMWFHNGATIFIEANNVTIKRSRFSCDPGVSCGTWIQVGDHIGGAGAAGVLIEDIELFGGTCDHTLSFSNAIIGSGYTLLRANIHNVGEAAEARGPNPVVIQDSYVHDLCIRDDLGSHNEDIGTNGFAAGFTIRHNNLENWDGQTGVVTLFADFSPVQNVTITDNLLNGAGYTIYGGSGDGKPYSAQTRNIVITNNHFGRKFYSNCGYYGPQAYTDPTSPSVWSGNVWDDTGQPVGI
jgi:hypothetical protein